MTRKYNEVQTTNTVIVGNKCDLPSKVPLEVVQVYFLLLPFSPLYPTRPPSSLLRCSPTPLLSFYNWSKQSKLINLFQKFATDHKATFIQTSAKTGENIEAIFTTLAKGFGKLQRRGGEGNKGHSASLENRDHLRCVRIVSVGKIRKLSG